MQNNDVDIWEIFKMVYCEPIRQSIIDRFDQTDDWLWKLSRFSTLVRVLLNFEDPNRTSSYFVDLFTRKHGIFAMVTFRKKSFFTQNIILWNQKQAFGVHCAAYRHNVGLFWKRKSDRYKPKAAGGSDMFSERDWDACDPAILTVTGQPWPERGQPIGPVSVQPYRHAEQRSRNVVCSQRDVQVKNITKF